MSSLQKLNAVKEKREIVATPAVSLKKKKRPAERKFISGRKLVLNSEGKWYNIKTVNNPEIDKFEGPRTTFSNLYDFVATLTLVGPVLFTSLVLTKLFGSDVETSNIFYSWIENLPLVGIGAGIIAVLGLEALSKITQHEDKKELAAAWQVYSRSAPIYQKAFENRVHANLVPKGSNNGFAVCVEYGDTDTVQLFEYRQGTKTQVRPIKTQTLQDDPDLAMQQVHDLALMAEEMEMSAWHAVSESDAARSIELEMAQANEQLIKEHAQQRRQAVESVLGETAVQSN